MIVVLLRILEQEVLGAAMRRTTFTAALRYPHSPQWLLQVVRHVRSSVRQGTAAPDCIWCTGGDGTTDSRIDP